jgi:hypothetical protein
LQSGCHRTRKVCPHAGRGAASGNVSAFPALQSGNSGILSACGDSTLQSGKGTWSIASASLCQSLPAPQCLTLPKCKVPPAHMLARCCQRLLCLQPPLPQAPALPHLLGVASTSLGQSLPAGSCQSLLAPQCFTLPRYPALLAHRLACCRQCLFRPEPPLSQAPALPHLLGIVSASLCPVLFAGSCQSLLAPQCLTLPHCQAPPMHLPACCCQSLSCSCALLHQAPALARVLGVASVSL